MVEQCGDERRGLLGEAAGLEFGGHEGVGAVVEHALGELLGVDGGLDPEVPEHGVGLPASEEHDGVAVDVGAEEGSGAARAEGAGGHFLRMDARGSLDGFGSMPQGVGHVSGSDFVPAVVLRVRVEVVMDRRGGIGIPLAEAECEAAESLARAESRVGGRAVADLFTAHCILLVTKLEGRGGDAIHVGEFIQRCSRRAVDGASDGEVDVLELEGLGAGLGSGPVGVFGWSEQPEEADDDEVADDALEGAVLAMSEVEDLVETAEDGGVDRVGSVGRRVFALESPEEIHE